MTEDEHRERLRLLGERYAEIDQARADALAELGQAMRDAVGIVTVSDMASLGHVSRPTAYKLLGKR